MAYRQEIIWIIIAVNYFAAMSLRGDDEASGRQPEDV